MRWFRRKRHGDKPAAETPAREGKPAAATRRPSSSREIAQLSMRGDATIIERFRRLCREDRRAQLEMLQILMDAYEGRGRR